LAGSSKVLCPNPNRYALFLVEEELSQIREMEIGNLQLYFWTRSSMNHNRIRTGYLVGFALTGLGVLVIVRGGFYHLGHFVDFSGYHIPFGITIFTLGVFFLFTAFRRKTRDLKDMALICPKCKESFIKEDIPQQRCPKCEVELEDLEGFYERHPELKAR